MVKKDEWKNINWGVFLGFIGFSLTMMGIFVIMGSTITVNSIIGYFLTILGIISITFSIISIRKDWHLVSKYLLNKKKAEENKLKEDLKNKKFTPSPSFGLHLKAFIIYVIYLIILNILVSSLFGGYVVIGIIGLVWMYYFANSEYKRAIKEGRNPKNAYISGVGVALVSLTLAAIIIGFLI